MPFSDPFQKFSKKDNNRLLLGEREAVLQEARNFGGIYVDPNPAVLSTLQQANIDPYMIYEQGMLAQIEKKIPKIDFIQADVDALFREWNGKPEGQIPIHVRQIFWLKKNAAAHNYQQSGNSWILK